MANNNETTPTNDACNRPALCAPSERYEPKIRSEKTSSNPQVSKAPQSKRVHRRTHSAGGEDASRSSLKKITRGVGGSPSKKMETLLTAQFERLSDGDRVRRVRMNSEKITKVRIVIKTLLMATYPVYWSQLHHHTCI